MKEIDANRAAWNSIAAEHYETFHRTLLDGTHKLNDVILRELGDSIVGKDIIHLQCNTGADTITLSRMGAKTVTGVDLAPENIHYARKLAEDTGTTNAAFIESDIMQLMAAHSKTYDAVFVSEGAIGWLPDLAHWGKTIRHLLRPGGFFYAFDSHPFMLCFDEAKLEKGEYDIKYPYFSKEPDMDTTIGGYASDVKDGQENFFWMYTVGSLVNSLHGAGLHLEYLHEYPELYYQLPGTRPVGSTGLYNYAYNNGRFPMSFSLKATVYK